MREGLSRFRQKNINFCQKFVYNVSPIENVQKSEQQISLRKASLEDHTDEISITFFGNLAEKVEKNKPRFPWLIYEYQMKNSN